MGWGYETKRTILPFCWDIPGTEEVALDHVLAVLGIFQTGQPCEVLKADLKPGRRLDLVLLEDSVQHVQDGVAGCKLIVDGGRHLQGRGEREAYGATMVSACSARLSWRLLP